MKLIKPSQVSGEILTLFEEADEKVVIVSPYCKIQKWYRLLNKIKSLQDRNIEIEFYVREGEFETIKEIEQLGIDPITIKNLHCKLYLNEKEAIISSMNLLLSSEINSLEIAYKTTNKTEYDELMDFYNRYIRQEEKENTEYNENHLFETISNEFQHVKIYENENEITIKTTRNTYSCFIWNKNKNENKLRISGLLSNKEFEYSKTISEEIGKRTKLEIECLEGGNKNYDTIWCTSLENLKTETINEMKSNEIFSITENIVKFIKEVEKIKSIK